MKSFKFGALALMITMALTATACGNPRKNVSATYSIGPISSDELERKIAVLQEVEGVAEVEVKHEVDGRARIVLHVSRKNEYPGKQKARELGFTKVAGY